MLKHFMSIKLFGETEQFNDRVAERPVLYVMSPAV